MISSNYQQVNFCIYYLIIFITLMPWRCHETGDFPNMCKVLGSKQRELRGFFSNFIPGHKLVPLFRRQPEPVSMAANSKLLSVLWEGCREGRGDEEMEQRLPFSTINPIPLCGPKYQTKFSVPCMKAGRGHSCEELGFWSTVSLCLIFRMCVKMHVWLNLRSFVRARRLFPQDS